MVVHEIFQTDTADFADILLPATTQLEQTDVHLSYGHLYALANNPAIAPLGEALPNTEVFRRLAARMGFTPQEVAEDATLILDGVTTADPLISNGHPYTVRVRLGDETRQSLDSIENTVFNSSSGNLQLWALLRELRSYRPRTKSAGRTFSEWSS